MSKQIKTNSWYFDSVFYQIYPQSFYDSNGDGIGDLGGIISKLDYLVELGIDAIWLNPIFVSPFKDAGYDIADYCKIAPRYGNIKIFDKLIRESHRRKIRILLDMVFNHTSTEHPWFQMSQKIKKNKFTKWYVWSKSPPKYPEGTWTSWCSERYEAYYHRFTHYQPDLNFGNPDLLPQYGNSDKDTDIKAMRQTLKKVVRFWLDYGIDGLRADVAEALVETIREMNNAPGTSDFWQEIREILDEYGDRVMVAEGWTDHIGDIRDSHFHLCFHIPQAWQLLSDFKGSQYYKHRNYNFFSPEGGDITWYVEDFLRKQYMVTAAGGSMSMLSGSHDMKRLSYICRDDDIIKVYFAFLLTYPNVPFIYYGDEIGMRYIKNLPSKEGACERAGSRTPMQWDSYKNAGFSTALSKRLYYPINTDFRKRNVASQIRDKYSVLNTVKKLITVRKSSASFGPFSKTHNLYLKDGSPVYIYSRYDNITTFVVALNTSKFCQNIKLKISGRENGLLGKKILKPVFGSNKRLESIAFGAYMRLNLAPRSFAIFQAYA